MSCPNTEKVVLLYYGELPFSEKEEIDRHIANCPQCRQTIEVILKLNSICANLSPSLEKVALERAISAGHSFSLREKALAVGLCLALSLFFVFPKGSDSNSFYQDSDFTAIESEISAIKYDMADFSDSMLDYAISCVDTGIDIEKEEV